MDIKVLIMNIKNKNKKPEGINIYKDEKERTIYYDFLTKKAYVISASKEKQFSIINNVYLYSILVFVMEYAVFNLSLPISIVLAVIVFFILEWRLRYFLKNCTYISNFKPKKANRFDDSSLSNGFLAMKATAYMVLGLLLGISVTIYKNDNSLVYGGSLALAVASVYISLKYLSIIIARIKADKKAS